MFRRMCLARFFGCGVLLLCLGTTLCNGQNCASNIVNQQLQCVNGRGCHNIWFNPEFEYEGPDYIYICEPFDCCGQLVTECRLTEYMCAARELSNPETSKRLSELATKSRLLVADCKGRYALYRPNRPNWEAAGAGPFVNDHILR
jgi:hypothetical protein